VRAELAVVGDNVSVGPFANLRPGTTLHSDVRVGNFVETKKAEVGQGSKLPHLSYVGDATLGRGVNIGAGTIFCNYDGVHKHHTNIGDGVFVGSNSSLQAPLHIGAGAYVAMASAITHDVPADALAVGRARQVNKDGYAAEIRAKHNKTVAAGASPADHSARSEPPTDGVRQPEEHGGSHQITGAGARATKDDGRGARPTGE
jgi:bifunctional UDP-N-acetylglucosamine pyrophosphorylase / glucosamine-1-phosphate N-acetyltransferase